MPSRTFSDWITACTNISEASIAPKIFQRWAAISAIAGALGRKCWYDAGQFRITPNMFIVLVGEPAVGKGVAMSLPIDMVYRYLCCPVSNRQEDLEEAKASYERYINFDQVPLRLEKDRITGEQLAVIMSKVSHMVPEFSQPYDPFYDASLTIAVAEFGVFMQKTYTTLQVLMTDAWDAKPEFNYKTKTAGEFLIKGPCINWIAGATPQQFIDCMPEDAATQGLLSRVVPVLYDGPKPKLRTYYPQLNTTQIEALRRDLGTVSNLKGTFKWETPELGSKVDAWLATGAKPMMIDPVMSGFNERRFAHQMKLAMVISASRSNDMLIKECDWELAKEWLWEVEQLMPKALEKFGRSRVGKMADELATLVRLWYDSKKKPMPLSLFKIQALRRISSPGELQVLLDTMIESKLVKWANDKETFLSPGDQFILQLKVMS